MDLSALILKERASSVPECASEVERLFALRGASMGESDYAWRHLPPPDALKGMPEVVARLLQARSSQERILIVGDYDSDGATSIAIMVRGLSLMGYQHVFFLVPNRFKHGYGLTETLIPRVLDYQPTLVITVDNGIQSVAAVSALQRQSIDVIVTDHHLPGAVLPDTWIINPNQPGCAFPDKHIAGCAVAWYVMVALRAHLRAHRALPSVSFNELSVLVAIGTVADCVRLTWCNRIWVQQGLSLIRSACVSPGVAALLQVASIAPEQINSGDIAFRLAPRLNAAGRLEDMSLGVQCLLSLDPHAAKEMAASLDALNAKRQSIQLDMQDQARAQCVLGEGPSVLFHRDWHQGVIGLIASYARELLKRPVLAFAWDEEKKCYKGSGRSVPEVHLKQVLDSVACRVPEAMLSFGGHAMAVGATVSPEHWDDFRQIFVEECSRQLPNPYHPVDHHHDGWVPEDCFSAAWFSKLYAAHPFGQGFEEPTYLASVALLEAHKTAKGHWRLGLRGPTGQRIQAWWFKKEAPHDFLRSGTGPLHILFQYLPGMSSFSIKILAYSWDTSTQLTQIERVERSSGH